jgi:DNA-binding GntR family transcriptional regulator
MTVEAAAAPELPADRAERAYSSLRAAIIEGALAPGTKLGEETLAAHYGVSRTLVRTVLARLVRDGLVASPHGRSAEVAHPTLDEARDAFVVRRALEREAVLRLGARWDDGIHERLRAHVVAEREAWADRRSAASARFGGEFHILLARESGNELLERYMSEVISRTALILRIYGRDIDQGTSIDEHDELIALLAAGHIDQAADHVTHHLDEVERKTLRADDHAGDPLLAVLSRY